MSDKHCIGAGCQDQGCPEHYAGSPVQGEVKPAAFMKHDSPIKGHTEFMPHKPWMDDGLSGGWIPLYTTPPQPAEVGELVGALRVEFPLFDDEGLDQEKHHCEWAMQQDRKRLHAALAKLGGKA